MEISSSLLAAILSVLTSVAGLPEVKAEEFEIPKADPDDTPGEQIGFTD